MKDLCIGNVKLDGNLILAPMAGVTDRAFRILCKERGASLVYTEMVSAKGIHYNNKNTEDLLAVEESERPAAVQLFGCDPDIMAETAATIDNRNFDILDINMGCPVPKVVNNGEGSALMKNPELASKIIKAVVRASSKPVTVKFRKGFDEDEETAVEFAKMAEDSGASAVAVHGRTRQQYYSGKADWNIIRRVKEAVSIPVIGNGDLFRPEDVKTMYEQTGCDAFMLARGVKGNPWLFSDILAYMAHGIVPLKPDVETVMQMLLRHAEMEVQFKGEFLGIREMRKHAAWYTSGIKNSAKFREKCNYIERLQDLKDIAFSTLNEL